MTDMTPRPGVDAFVAYVREIFQIDSRMHRNGLDSPKLESDRGAALFKLYSALDALHGAPTPFSNLPSTDEPVTDYSDKYMRPWHVQPVDIPPATAKLMASPTEILYFVMSATGFTVARCSSKEAADAVATSAGVGRHQLDSLHRIMRAFDRVQKSQSYGARHNADKDLDAELRHAVRRGHGNAS